DIFDQALPGPLVALRRAQHPLAGERVEATVRVVSEAKHVDLSKTRKSREVKESRFPGADAPRNDKHKRTIPRALSKSSIDANSPNVSPNFVHSLRAFRDVNFRFDVVLSFVLGPDG